MIKRTDANGNVKRVTNIRVQRKWRRFLYLLSSGTQYIDTGVNFSTIIKAEIEFVVINVTNTGMIFGAYYDDSNYPRYLFYTAQEKFITTGYISTIVNQSLCIANLKYSVTIQTALAVPQNQDVTIHLFARNNDRNVPIKHKGLKLYDVKIYSDSNLVRHFVPAEYLGQYGMWDLVEDKFYGNAGTGTFTVGTEVKNYDEIDTVRRSTNILPAGVELYDYILSSGTQYIDSGWIVNYDKGFEVETKYNPSSSGERACILSSYYGGLHCISLEITTGSRFFAYDGALNHTSNISMDTDHISIFKFDNYNYYHTVDGTSRGSGALSSFTGSETVSAYLFLDRIKRTTTFNKLFKIYYLKIKELGLLVRNFLPCTYLGEPGMWDTVENKFYRNQGTGLFTLGSKITLKEYEYLATTSNGNLSINNNIILTEGHTLTYDIIFKYDATGVRRLMGPSANASAYFGVTVSNVYEMVSSVDNIPVGNIDHIYEHFDAINGKITRQLNDLQSYTRDHTINKMIGYPTFIFALSGSTSYTGSGQYFYSGKILYDGKVARDYVPCSYNGEYGLWDKVEWKFYANAGTGTFTLGPEKASGDYPVWTNSHVIDLFGFRITANGNNVRRSTALLENIKGNSIAWNLLISESNPSYNGCSRTNNSDGSFTATPSGTNTYSLYYPTTYSLILANNTHRYYISSFIKADNGLLTFGLIYYNGSGPHTGHNILVTPTTSLLKYSFITSVNIVSGRLLGVTSYANNIPTSFTIKNFICIDLTLIYGSGNEPTTVAQFEADYYKWFGKPLTYEPYDVGSLRCVKSTGLKSVGFNQQSENMELGRYALDTGIKYDLNNCIRISNPIKVFPNTNYYVHNPHVTDNYYLWILYLDNDGKLIEKISGNNNYIGPENIITATPINASKLIFYIYGATNYNNDVCINLANSKLNGIYKPYNSQTIFIPITSIKGKLNGSGSSVTIFPDGMKRVGSVYDEIYVENGVTKAIRRVGSINLGNLNWTYESNIVAFKYNLPNYYYKGEYNTPIICPRYLYGGTVLASSDIANKADKFLYAYYTSAADYNQYRILYIKDSAYTNVNTFKNTISNVYIYYLLPTPEEYIIDNFTLPILYGVERGGTEEVLSDTVSLSPTLDIKYSL